MTFSNKIDKILSVGIALHDSNIHNWALTKNQILHILQIFDEEKIAIAGGDVMDVSNGEIGFSGASWHVEKEKDEDYNDFIRRSIEHTRRYVINYRASESIYFILVPW